MSTHRPDVEIVQAGALEPLSQVMAANARFSLENGQGDGPFCDRSTLRLPSNDEPTTETGIFDHLVSQELQGGRGQNGEGDRGLRTLRDSLDPHLPQQAFLQC